MTFRTHYLAAAAAIAALAAPAAAQYAQPYPQAYPQYQQTYPQSAYPQSAYPGYAQPGYAYGQPGYGQGYSQNPVTAIIDGLLGNRYNVTDRTAVSQCANAAIVQASARYRGGYGNGYGNGGYSNLRVTSISDVQRRGNGLRVSGMLSSGYGGQYGGQYGNQYGYQNRGHAIGDVSFRCNVAYNGAVTNVRIGQPAYRR